MMKSDTINDLSAALAKAQAEFKVVGFNRLNPHFKNRYADLTAVINATRPALATHGLAVAQFPTADGQKVTVETVLTHSSGQYIAGALTLQASKADAQGVGAAITYAKRYGMCAILGVSADEDDDGNAASEPPPTQRAVEQKPKAEPKMSDRQRFGKMIAEWAGLAPEDAVAAARDACKRLGIDSKDEKVDWSAAVRAIQDARELKSWMEWIASKE